MSDHVANEVQAVHGSRTVRPRVVVAGPGLAHTRQHVERRVPGMGRVRVGASVEKPCGQLEVAVGHRDQKRRRSGADGAAARQRTAPLDRLAWRRRVHVDTRPEQRLHHVDPSFAHGEQERREAGVQGRVGLRADLEQQFDDLQVALGGRPHERRLAPLGFAEVDVGAGLVERFDHLDPAGPRRGHEDRLAAREHRVGVGSRGQ